MMQISNRNTVFLVLSFHTKDREHNCLSENSPVCELPSTTLLPCQPAARPIPLQYASPPVDLVRMLFIAPQTNRIADEHLDYTASLSSFREDFSLQARYQSRTHLPLLFVLSPAIAVSHWTGDYIPVYLHHTVQRHEGKSINNTVHDFFFVFAVRRNEGLRADFVNKFANTHER